MARNVYNVDETLKQEFNFKHLKRLFGYLKPHRKKLLFALFLMIMASLANIIIPLLVKETIDHVIPEQDGVKLIWMCVAFAAVIVISAICLKKRILTVNQLGQTIIETMRKDLFVHLQKLPFSFYDDRPHGKIIVRVVNYVNSVSDLLSGSLVNVLAEGSGVDAGVSGGDAHYDFRSISVKDLEPGGLAAGQQQVFQFECVCT